MADKDTREDGGLPGEMVPLPDEPRSEGGPVTREPDTGSGSVTAPPAASGTEVHDAVETSDMPGSDAAQIADAMIESEAVASEIEGMPSGSPQPDIEEINPATDQSVTAAEPTLPETGSSDGDAWHSAIADVLSEPDGPAVSEHSDPLAPGAPAAPAQPADPQASDDHGHGGSFTAAAEDLFRPAEVADDPHLITIGRRLDPALRIPRPLAPDIPARPEVAGVPVPWWKTTPWLQHLRTAARYGLYALGGYLALVLVLIVLFRFVNPPGSSYMLGQLLTGTAIDRTWVPLESISPHLVRAVIVSEDGRFCEHSGIDTAAIKDAIERAARGRPRGASTISMQTTKNLFLWNARGYVRKVIEIPLTLFMEMIWPKARILEVYLNIAEWAPGVFGAEAAARHHFNKPAQRLSDREAALLAAVLPNPVVRNAGSPGPRTSAKARVVQARVKAYGAVASCVVSRAAATPAREVAPTVTRPSAPARKAQPQQKPAPRKQAPQTADDWAPTLNFGPR